MLTYILCTTVYKPIFFGLFYSKHEVELAAYFTREDATRYALEVCGFNRDQFYIKRCRPPYRIDAEECGYCGASQNPNDICFTCFSNLS